jgi:hypothetical protein
MTREVQRDPGSMISRRTLVHGLAIAAGATVVGASGALAQQGGELGPPTTITSPPRDFGPGGAPTTYFWDPDRDNERPRRRRTVRVMNSRRCICSSAAVHSFAPKCAIFWPPEQTRL